MSVVSERKLPVDVIFHPSWWYGNYGIEFSKDFFTDPEVRVKTEQKMDHLLYNRLKDLGFEQDGSASRPIVGPIHLAAGYVISELLGCEVKFNANASPDVIVGNLSDDDIMALRVPCFENVEPTRTLIEMMNTLEEKYGFIEGDFNWSGILNIALDLRGQQLFLDFFEQPDLVRHLFDVIFETIVGFVKYMLSRTGTSSLSVNPSVKNFSPQINLHSNCSVVMISPQQYEELLLPYEKLLSKNLKPYGIHHCGDKMHVYAESYAKIGGVEFFDVGWGADIKKCREILPDAFFNIRLNPVRLLGCSASDVESDILDAVKANDGIDNMGLCCINMDYGTPDDNVRKIYEVAERLRNAV